MSADPRPKQSPQQCSHHLLCELLSPTPLRLKGSELKPSGPRPSPASSSLAGPQPPAANARVLLRVPTKPLPVPSSRERGPGLGLRAAPGLPPSRATEALGAARPEAASRPRPRPRPRRRPGAARRARIRVHSVLPRAQLALSSLGCHPTPRPGAQKAEVFGREKTRFLFSPSSEPLLEKMLLSSFISRANHLPRCQELRPGEIKYPIILLGRAGRGGEAGTRTKHSFQSACPHQITPGEARQGPALGRP